MAGAGTLTVLFTDLVGSTASLVALGEDRYDSIRDEHDALVGGTIAAYHGEIVKHTGDGYMAVFRQAGDAVAAAAENQRLIAGHNEDSEVALAMRIGISAGDVIERAGDYHGVAAVEAARLCSAAMGGQVLASETVRSLVGSAGGHDFVALGELDLKGLPPVATVALRWCEDAPVVAPARGAKGNLPASLDSFVGRHRDLDEIRGLLGEHRLVTLTGPGGSGKTRLALEVARSLAHEEAGGAWLVELAAIDDEKLIAETTMTALGLRANAPEAMDALRSYLSARETLLLVDNCEHVLDRAAPLIAELLASCPAMRVLATSREPLRVPGEVEYAVEGLVGDEAAELFAARVPRGGRVDNPDAIERICASLEGIPLALELAAAKLRVFSPEQLADRLDDQLSVLGRGPRAAPERQRTLRATLDWSYGLLDEDERVLFRRLAIFAGGFRADAAEAVVADDRIPPEQVLDLLERLVERSLVTSLPGSSRARFRLLEPVRQYGMVRLSEAEEHEVLAGRHLEWVRGFARQASWEFFVSQQAVTVRIRDEHPNVAQALEFALNNGDAIAAARIVGALGWPWFAVGQPDARAWYERVLAVLPADAPPVARAAVLVAMAMTLASALEYDASVNLAREARDLCRNVKSARGEAWALTWLARDAYFRAPASPEAKALFEEALSLYRESGVQAGEGWCLNFLALGAWHAEDDALARCRAEEAVQVGRSSHINQVVAEGLRVLALLDSRAGDFDDADRRIAETIAIHEAAGDSYQLLVAYSSAAEMAASRGDITQASSYLARAAGLVHEMQSRERILDLVTSAAHVSYMAGSDADAALLFSARLALDPLTFPKRFRPFLEALEKRGLGEEIAVGANLKPDEAFERAIQVISRRRSAPA